MSAIPGSVYQRKDGYWCAALSVTGRRVIRYASTQRQAETRLADMLREFHLGRLAPPTKITLGAWVEQWLDQMAPTLRPSTLDTYRDVLALVTGRPIGRVRLDKLTPSLLANTFAALAQGRGARRIHLAHGYLRQCLERAVDLDVIAVNPMARVPKPKWAPRERRYWTVEEAGRFVHTALSSATRWAPLFVLLSTCGLRVSEALGLRWSDVDLRAKTLRVERALVWVDRECIPGAVKTRSARRAVSLPEAAVQALQKLPRSLDPEQPVFRTANDTPPNPAHLRNSLGPLCDKAGVSVPNIHGLRHVAAMLALQATGDIHLVQRRLGHSTPVITMSLYAYSPHADARVADAVGELLSRRDVVAR